MKDKGKRLSLDRESTAREGFVLLPSLGRLVKKDCEYGSRGKREPCIDVPLPGAASLSFRWHCAATCVSMKVTASRLVLLCSNGQRKMATCNVQRTKTNTHK